MKNQLAICGRRFLVRAAGERQQGDVARLLDCRRQTALVRRAYAGQAPGNDLAALGDEAGEQAHVLVIDGLDLLDAELANLLAAEKFAATFAASAGTTGTRTARVAGIAWTGTVRPVDPPDDDPPDDDPPEDVPGR